MPVSAKLSAVFSRGLCDHGETTTTLASNICADWPHGYTGSLWQQQLKCIDEHQRFIVSSRSGDNNKRNTSTSPDQYHQLYHDRAGQRYTYAYLYLTNIQAASWAQRIYD